jgi:NCS1 family nucleobase:cation symporter-1
MANHLPESAGISSRDLLAFFLFWMIEMPFLTVHPSKIKFLFAKSQSNPADNILHRPSRLSALSPASVFLLGVCTMEEASELKLSLPQRPLLLGVLGWAMMNGINSCLGVTSALLVNVGNYNVNNFRPYANILYSNLI